MTVFATISESTPENEDMNFEQIVEKVLLLLANKERGGLNGSACFDIITKGKKATATDVEDPQMRRANNPTNVGMKNE